MKKWRSYRSCGSEAWKTKLQPGTQTNTWKYVSKNSLISLLSMGVVVHFDTHTHIFLRREDHNVVCCYHHFLHIRIYSSGLLFVDNFAGNQLDFQERFLNISLCSCSIINNNSTLLKLSNLFVSQHIHLLIDDHPLSWWASQVCKQLVEATTLALGSIFFSTSIRRIHPQREELGTLSNPAKIACPCPW